MEAAYLASGIRGKIKGEKCSDVCGLAVFEDFAVCGAVVDCASPDFVLRSDIRSDDVGRRRIDGFGARRVGSDWGS